MITSAMQIKTIERILLHFSNAAEESPCSFFFIHYPFWRSNRILYHLKKPTLPYNNQHTYAKHFPTDHGFEKVFYSVYSKSNKCLTKHPSVMLTSIPFFHYIWERGTIGLVFAEKHFQMIFHTEGDQCFSPFPAGLQTSHNC